MCSAPLLPDDSGLDSSLGRYESLPHGVVEAAFPISARAKCSSPLLPDDSVLDASLGRYESLPHGAIDAAVRIAYCGCALFKPLGPGTMLQEAAQGPKDFVFLTFRCLRYFRFPLLKF